jgi:hypothetical protein
VRDQDRSLRFYLDQLGFDLAFDAHLQSRPIPTRLSTNSSAGQRTWFL